MTRRRLRVRVPSVACAVAAVVTAVTVTTSVTPVAGVRAAPVPVPAVVVATALRYVPGEVVLVQGGSLTLVNGEAATHDVRADETGADGQPLFESDQIGRGETAPVVGVDTLEPGVYTFFCTVHPSMVGLLNVKPPPV